MRTPLAAALAALTLATLVAPAGAQRHPPRYGVAVEPRPATPAVPYPAYPGASVTIDPRGPTQHLVRGTRGQPLRGGGEPQVVYVPVPVIVDGYGYPVAPQGPYGAYGVTGAYGGVTDVNGRPLSMGFEPSPAPTGGAGYTPDFSGSPYVVVEDGLMVVALAGGERSIPPCASAKSVDPAGRPRTVFYQPTEYALILREGQTGRVQGAESAGAKACYALDAWGRVAVR